MKRILSTALIVIIALSLSGCGFFNSLFGLGKDEKAKDTASSVVTIYTLIDDMSRSLVSSAGCSAGEAKVLVDGANAAAAADPAQKTDLQGLIPVAVGGTVSSLGSATFAAWNDARKIACVDAIVASFVASLDGKFTATSQARSMRSLSDSAAMVNDILASISKAAIDNLSKTGISAKGLADAAGGVVASIIGSLGDGGVNKVLVNSAVGSITQSAVATLKAAGFSEGVAMELAVKAIAKGAVSALSSVTIAGVTSSDYPGLATQIAKSAATAIGSFAAIDQVAGLVGAAAAGAAQGIVAADAHRNIDAAIVSLMAEGIVSGGTAGALAISFVDPASSGASLIAAITTESSTVLTANVAALGVSEAVLLTDVTVGAASGAVSSGGYASTALSALTSAISLVGSNGSAATVVGTDVQSGINKGDNKAPVANAGADSFAKTGEAVSLEGSATDADPGETATLTYAWTIVQRPATSSQYLAIANSNSASASFTPDVGGPYVLSLLVTDVKGATGEAFRVVTAVAATSATYQGVSADARLASATSYMDSGEWAKARDELLILVTYYPETGLTPEATLKLSRCYKKLGNDKLATERALEVVTLYASSAVEPKARLDLGWLYLNSGDTTSASAQFDTLVGRATADALYADAVHGQGVVLMDQAKSKAEYDAALAKLKSARDSVYADVYVRYYSQSAIADLLFREYLAGIITDLQVPINAIKLTITEPKYNCADPLNPSTKLVDLVYKSVNDLFWGYHQMGLFQKAIDLADEQLALASGTDFSPWMRLQLSRFAAERELWDIDPTKANFLKAKDRLATALAAYTGSDFAMKQERDWAQLRLGQANGRLVDTENDASLKSALVASSLAAYDAVAADFGSAWGTRQAGEAKLEKAAYILFGTRDYAASEALLLSIIAQYPYDIDQYPRAGAFLRLGDVYRERGNEARDKYGLDGTASFKQALFYYFKVKSELFPGLGASEWYFAEAARNIGSCYMGLGQWENARKQLAPLLDSDNFDAGQKAQIQVSIAQSYASEGRGLAGGGTFSGGAIAKVEPAYAAVSDFKNGDGSLVNHGQESAQAWTELGRFYADLARAMEDYGYSDKAAIAAAWQSSHDNYSKALVANAYPGLDATNWTFRESLRELGRSLAGFGSFADARAAYENCIAKIGSVFSETDRAELLRDIARSYRIEADSVWGTAPRGNVKDLLDQSIAEYQKVLDLGKDLDDGEASGWSRSDMIGDYSRLCDLTVRSWPGLADDIPVRNAYLATVTALMSAPGAFMKKDGLTIANNGRSSSDAYVLRGSINQLCGDAYRELVSAAGWEDICLSSYDAAIADYLKMSTFADCWPDSVIGARQALADSYLSECGIYLGKGDLSRAAELYSKADAEAYSVLVDPYAKAYHIAYACRSMGRAFLNLGPGLTGTTAFANDAAWILRAKYWLKLVLDNAVWKGVDGGAVGSDCQAGLDAVLAYESTQ